MEKALIGAMFLSRKSFDLITEYIVPARYSKRFQVILAKISEYYQVDRSAGFVHIPTFISQIQASVASEKQADELITVVNESAAEAISIDNVEHVVLLAKRQELRDELAIALTQGKDDDELHDAYRRLLAATDLRQLTDRELNVIDKIDVIAWSQQAGRGDGLLELMPASLNERLDGGLQGGDHVLLFARPEAGKTALVINAMGGFARQGQKGLYLGNEDRIDRLEGRTISNLSGMTKQQIVNDPQRARDVAVSNGLDNIKLIEFYPGTPRQIEELIDKYEPDWIIVDQLRNLAVKADNRVLQLEKAAFLVRNMAKKYNLKAISVTQAGDSADGKAVLEMGDIDWSNTGMQAHADVMIGLGVNPDLEASGMRMISLPKNKLSGRHESFPVKIIPQLSRYTSV